MTNKYCQKHKERLWKEARERYLNLSEEEKEKRHKRLEKEKRHNKNLYGEQKKKLVEYWRNNY